jgi:tetratricopeptide (TPR) repeat protein
MEVPDMRQRSDHSMMVTIVAVLLLAIASTAPSAPARAQTVEEALAACQEAYDAGDLAGSREAARAAIAADPESYRAHWMLARVLLDLGNKAGEKDERQALYEEAERSARRAVAIEPDDTWGHHYLAASLGKLALFHGGKTKIELSKEVRDEALRAIELDPGNDKALHVMGRWHHGVATLGALKRVMAKVIYGGVPEGSLEEAVGYYERAIAVNPDHINHHLELGKTLMEMRRYEEAAAQFQIALDLPAHDPNDPEYKAEAAEQLEKAQKRAKGPREDKSR